ncbi:MAG: CCA-adding enzyme [Euryarchaeota archaeon RBG_16_62_10]|nr:MAG: CCA-adding enzyme [Euryarchaeota archaeon RBG_16_62_10]
MTIESEVLREIRPPAAQDRKVMAAVADLSEKVLSAARDIGAHVEPMLVGSVAKGTHLKDPDIDLFMLFPESTPLEELKNAGLEIGRRVVDGREHYAQHPYVRGAYKGFLVDLVPCFRIHDTRKKMSAVDRTPFHTEFVKKNLRKGMADEVRLLKRFMKGVECYGAEAKVQGFSGYLCELLVMRFGSFGEVLTAAKGWTVGTALELPGYPGNEFPEPMTFVDPVDPSRNVASAVAPETLLRFILASREYLESPRTEFFFPRPRETWAPARVKEVAGRRLDNMISVSFPKLDLIDDVVYPQLRKSLTSMTALLERADFEVEKTSIHVDGSTHLMVELGSISLPKERRHRGPPVNSENVNEFLEKWNAKGISAPYVEDGRWYVMTTREHDRADALVREKLAEIPLGKDVKKAGRFEIVSGQELLADRNLAALTHHFDERMPWKR